jgi:hypothetical protein
MEAIIYSQLPALISHWHLKPPTANASGILRYRCGRPEVGSYLGGAKVESHYQFFPDLHLSINEFS